MEACLVTKTHYEFMEPFGAYFPNKKLEGLPIKHRKLLGCFSTLTGGMIHYWPSLQKLHTLVIRFLDMYFLDPLQIQQN